MSDNRLVSLLIAPSPFSFKIIENLKPHCEIHHIAARKRLYPKVRDKFYCYLLLEGSVVIHQQKNDLALITSLAPAIFGINFIASRNIIAYLKVASPSTIGVISQERALELIDEKQLWKDVAQHLMLQASKLCILNDQMLAATTYEQIKFQLLQLMAESHSFRQSITAQNYIQQKTLLSRSGIMRVLNQLRDGNYIAIQRGVLININKLPDKF